MDSIDRFARAHRAVLDHDAAGEPLKVARARALEAALAEHSQAEVARRLGLKRQRIQALTRQRSNTPK